MTATETKALTKGQIVANDISSLLRARNALIWIVTREETRVENFLVQAASLAGYNTGFWDVAAGATLIGGKADPKMAGTQDLGAMLTAIATRSESRTANADKPDRNVWVVRDPQAWITGPVGAAPLRQLRNLAKALPRVPRPSAQAIIVLSTSADIPADLAGHATVVEWPLPDRAEIAAVLDAAIRSLPETDEKTGEPVRANAATPETRELAIDAAVGLTEEEAASCYAKSLVQSRKIDAALVSNEKKRVISRERVLEWYDPLKGGLDAVGGLDNLKDWLSKRRLAYSPEARAYGLPSPKGAGLVGISGCGKSLTAKAIATSWSVPLLRLDLNALKAKFVGDSEGNLRKALKVIEAIGRCVVWIDEIEKALAGATQGGADGGVSADALGTILSWMQERAGEAFVIVTANDVSSLPPELLRKGRFDEVFFVDLPNHVERKSVLRAALKTHGRDKVGIDFELLATRTANFTGSEIAELVPTALFAAFDEGAREITTEDLVNAASAVVPLSKTKEKVINDLREWGKANARAATKALVEVETAQVRELDLA